MTEFHQTFMGRDFYEKSIPDICNSLSKIAAETKRANDLKEKELELLSRKLSADSSDEEQLD